MALIIRQIQPNDNKILSILIKSVFIEFGIDKPGTVFSDPTTDFLYEVFQAKKSVYFVAEMDGIILGGCGIYPTKGLPYGYAELVKFYLHPSARNKGIGQQLLDKSIEFARKNGYYKLYLESFPELQNALSLYKKKGFKILNEPLGHSGHHACSIWMEIDI